MSGRLLTAILGAALAVAVVPLAAAEAGIGPNPANDPAFAGKRIDALRYDRATRCRKGLPRGTRLLVNWLERHTDGAYWGAYRCEKWGKKSFSVHSEGRAIDWAMDARNGKLKKQAMKLIRKRLLADDRHGNPSALARRMGVQGLIYNCRAWFASPGGLGPYSYCFKRSGKRRKNLDATQAHIDHIHIELSKPGSRAKTSFWRSSLAKR